MSDDESGKPAREKKSLIGEAFSDTFPIPGQTNASAVSPDEASSVGSQMVIYEDGSRLDTSLFYDALGRLRLENGDIEPQAESALFTEILNWSGDGWNSQAAGLCLDAITKLRSGAVYDQLWILFDQNIGKLDEEMAIPLLERAVRLGEQHRTQPGNNLQSENRAVSNWDLYFRHLDHYMQESPAGALQSITNMLTIDSAKNPLPSRTTLQQKALEAASVLLETPPPDRDITKDLRPLLSFLNTNEKAVLEQMMREKGYKVEKQASPAKSGNIRDAFAAIEAARAISPELVDSVMKKVDPLQVYADMLHGMEDAKSKPELAPRPPEGDGQTGIIELIPPNSPWIVNKENSFTPPGLR